MTEGRIFSYADDCTSFPKCAQLKRSTDRQAHARRGADVTLLAGCCRFNAALCCNVTPGPPVELAPGERLPRERIDVENDAREGVQLAERLRGLSLGAC